MKSTQATHDAAGPAQSSGAPAAFRPELLAPAGDWECARAAVENGADAIYFGLSRFNARMRAKNFTEADLPALLEFLHRRGVRGYVTFNTLVFQNEMAEAEAYLRAIIAAGADAAIVQDAGICRLIRRLSPDFPIHVSTQMTVTSAAGVGFARDLGCNLVVLARENSLRDIAAMQQALAGAGAPAALPLEVFVHGALCVAYSGQCLTSEALGGRSANRGECAQACRMPYELISDGRTVPLGDRRYLLSPQDLAGLDLLPELARLGIASLKIEGRLKSPQYVASITRIYREALDRLGAGGPAGPARDAGAPEAATSYELEMAFSRGLSSGWFRGIDNQRLVHARFGKKRGVFLGPIESVQGESLWLTPQAPLQAGDGVVIDTGTGGDDEQGGRVFSIRQHGPRVQVFFRDGQIQPRRVRAGDRLWKTDDPFLNKRIRHTYAGDTPRFQRPVRFEAHGHAGVPLTVIARDELGNVVQAESGLALVPAEKHPLQEATLAAQLGRLGGTPFRLESVLSRIDGAVILPLAELNRLRRELVAGLDQRRAEPKRWTLHGPTDAPCPSVGPGLSAGPRTGAPELIVLVRNGEQLDAALAAGVATIYCEFEDPKKYREAVARVHAFPGQTDPPRSIWVAPPRIFKPGEEWTLQQVRSSGADGYLVRNYDHLKFFADVPRLGDFSLNVANALTAEYFKNRFGLERLTASYDLNVAQLGALLQAAPPEWFEITLHQHIPMFHMEHCVFCAFLSQGTDYTNCGRPCDRHEVRLRDRVGAEHVLKADAGCRNTLYNAAAQTGAEQAAHLLGLGVRHFRIEFLAEPPAQVTRTIERYRQLLRGEITGHALWRELKLINQLGVTRGTLDAR